MPDKITMPQKITTKACVVSYKGAPFNLCDVLLEEVRPDEVLVEMKYTGICHTVRLALLVSLTPHAGHGSED